MATSITQTTSVTSHTMPAIQATSSTSNSSHSNTLRRPSNATSSSIQQYGKSSSSLHEPCVKSAIVFAFSLNDIIKSHLPEKKFRNDREKIEVHFTQKLIGKIQLNFSELVLTLIYCNRYLRYCRKYKLPMPGSPGSVFPSMTHMVIPCLLLAEVYLIDCPHNSKWWATKCSGGVTVQNINRWKRDVLVTMKYWLYVEPTRDFVNWTRQIKKLAFALFGQNSWKYNLSNSSTNNDPTNKPQNGTAIVKASTSSTTSSFVQPIKSPVKTIKSPVKTIKSPVKTTKSPVKTSKSPTKASNSPIKKTTKRSSSSFHSSLQNHLNSISSRRGLYKHNGGASGNQEFSIRNIKYEFSYIDYAIHSFRKCS